MLYIDRSYIYIHNIYIYITLSILNLLFIATFKSKMFGFNITPEATMSYCLELNKNTSYE